MKKLFLTIALASCVFQAVHCQGELSCHEELLINASTPVTIKSPGYPNPYPEQPRTCTYLLRAETGARILLKADQFGLRYSTNSMDNITVTDDASGMRIGVYTTFNGPKGLVSAGNSITVRFTSNVHIKSYGTGKFWITASVYEEFPKVYRCPDSTNKNPTHISHEQFCDGNADCPNGADEFCRPNCGKQVIQPNWDLLDSHIRIVNGSVAVPHSWPWQIGFYFKRSLICGGTLIAPQWVMTAAHCCAARINFITISVTDVTVVTGAHDLGKNEASQRHTRVKKMYIHPNYTTTPATDNDFCLLHLEYSVRLDEKTHPACLPESETSQPPAGTVCYTTGWGSMRSGGSAVDELQQVPIVMHDQAKCNVVYDGKITETMFCGYNHLRDTCQGDSGGPFVCKNNDTQAFELTGVTSWGRGCAVAGVPGVYAKTMRSMDWISKTLYEANYEGWHNATEYGPDPTVEVTTDAATMLFYTPFLFGVMASFLLSLV